MNPEGFRPDFEEIARAEKSMSENQRLASRLRERALENFEEPLTLERKAELERELAGVADFFNGYGKPWFVAGGTALELANGGLQRDHQDSDIAMDFDDVKGLYDYGQEQGYSFVGSDGVTPVASEPELLSQGHNAFARKTEGGVGPQTFEVMFLQRDEKGDVSFGKNGFSFPKEAYVAAPKFVLPDGREIRVTPPEVQLFYKILDGRQKDFDDIKKYLPALSVEARGRLDAWLAETGASFVIDGRKTNDVGELLRIADDTTRAFQKRFAEGGADAAVAERMAAFDVTGGKLYEAAERAESKAGFVAAVKEVFGKEAEGIIAQRAAELGRVADFLFDGGLRPDKAVFVEFFQSEFGNHAQIEKDVKSIYVNAARWRVEMG